MKSSSRSGVVALALGTFVLAGAIAGASSVDAVDAPALPGPAPRGHASTLGARAANDACAACHADVAEEWRSSLHARSFVDPVFRAAYAIEPAPFCRGCHAPEANPDEAPGAAADDAGVGCITCHVEDGSVVGASGKKAGGSAGHDVIADPRMARADACGACHEFDFPSHEGRPMQDTLAEHARSPRAAVACQGCHMTSTGSGAKTHLDHRFRVIGDAEMLRSAARITARREGDDLVVVTLVATGAGHAFPTGDMFRRLEVRASTIADDRPSARAVSVHLGREFRAGESGGPFDRIETADSRIPADGTPRVAEVRFAEPVGDRSVHWQVAYQRMDGFMAAMFGVDARADEVIVAEGDLPASAR